MARGVQGIKRICDEHVGDDRALRVALLEEIRGHVGFDAHAWLLTDPVTEVGSAPVADVPCLPELPLLIRLKYLTALNRWTGIVGPDPVTLDGATGGQLGDSLVWDQLLSQHAVRDVAAMAFRDQYGCWGFLDLWRCGTEPFTAGDCSYLAEVSAPVTAALRRSQAQTFRHEVDRSGRDTGPVVLLLSAELEVQAQTPGTDDHLRRLVPPDPGRGPVPAAAYNVGAQLIAREAGVDDHPASARVHLGHGAWVTLRAARIAGADPADGSIAVTIEPTPPSDRLDLFARTHGLSPRETELLGLLGEGSDTRLVAATLHLSELTVQDHLKTVFAKTGVRNRRALVARAAGR